MAVMQKTDADRDGDAILAAAPGATMLAALVDGVLIVNSRGRIRYANAAASRMFGREPGELRGAPVETLMPAATAAAHQGYIDRFLASGEPRVIGRGRPVEGVGRDGQPVYIHLAVIEFDYDGERHFLGITHDRTAETVATRDLNDSLDRLHRSQRFGGIGSWAWSVDSDHVYWSETVGPMFGYPPGERLMPQSQLMDRIHPDDRPPMYAAIKACIRQAIPYRVEHRVIWPDGTLHWLIMEGDSERDEDGRARRLLGVVRDVTQRKAMEQALIAAKDTAERANRAQSEFISSVSHEIRTPLNTILGYAELLQAVGDRPDHAAKVAPYARSILDAGRHLLTIVNDILDLALIEGGRLALSIEPVAPAPVAAKAIAMVDLMAGRRSITIVDETVSRPDTVVMADAGRLRQVLVNLLSNAIKYNFDHGRVTVRTRPAPDAQQVRIEIEDTGCGIPAERHADVFRRFHRLGAEQSTIEGAGIGLALTRHLVEAMGGMIGFDSAPGRGSLFWVDLARAPADRLPRPAAEPIAEFGYRGAVRRILVVEDNPMNFEILREVLKALGEFEIDWARHAGEVHHRLAAARPDLVFLDINLPGEDGYAVARSLRGCLGAACPPIFGLSANAYDDARQKALAAGFAGYIAKPFRIEQIRAALDYLPPDKA